MRTLLALAAVSLLAAPLSAQQWSAQQQEVVTQLERCWDVWVEATKTGSPDAWIDQCTDNFRYWGVDLAVPNDVGEVRRRWSEISRGDWRWVSLRPLNIRIVDDIAVVHFYGAWSSMQNDERVTEEDKRTEVFRNVSGRWLLLAGHSQPSGN